MRDFILVFAPLLFLILGVLFLHKYFNKQHGKREWLNLWYGTVFLLVTIYIHLYVLINDLIL